MSHATRNRALVQRRQIEQGLAEMVGLIRGVIADGRVSKEEAVRLSEWTRENPEVATRWPANLLASRLERIFLDGRVDSAEKRHLAALLSQLAENPNGFGGGFPLATDLPFTQPAPEIEFENRTFVFAGAMAYGPRHACEREVIELGGTCERAVNRRTDFVVVGSISAEEWHQASLGDVLDEVVQYAARGVPIALISEERWLAALP